jgi:hypothetical protein
LVSKINTSDLDILSAVTHVRANRCMLFDDAVSFLSDKVCTSVAAQTQARQATGQTRRVDQYTHLTLGHVPVDGEQEVHQTELWQAVNWTDQALFHMTSRVCYPLSNVQPYSVIDKIMKV